MGRNPDDERSAVSESIVSPEQPDFAAYWTSRRAVQKQKHRATLGPVESSVVVHRYRIGLSDVAQQPTISASTAGGQIHVSALFAWAAE